jgi:hypothetical protein
LCVSFLSDINAIDFKSQISDLKFSCVMSDNSHYSIVKELLLLSTKRRNFNPQFGRRLMLLVNIPLPSFESSGYDLVESAIRNRKSAMSWWR